MTTDYDQMLNWAAKHGLFLRWMEPDELAIVFKTWCALSDLARQGRQGQTAKIVLGALNESADYALGLGSFGGGVYA